MEGFETDSSAFTPGRFEYNNLNYMLLSYIAQKITGIVYLLLLESRVLQPVGMLVSGLDALSRKSAGKATGNVTDRQTNQWVPNGIFDHVEQQQ